MRINIDLTDDDRARLRRALGPDEDVDAVASLVAKAGAVEMLELATGRSVPATFAEARGQRIYSLLRQGVPLADVERLVAAIFKVPRSSANRLVGSAVARYAVELDETFTSTIRHVLDAARWDDEEDRWELTLDAGVLRERVLSIAQRLSLPDPKPARRGPLWHFADETYQAVRKEWGMSARTPP